MSSTPIPSLVVSCRTVVTNNLERYTPESFYICDIYEWEEIVRLRHSMTQPKNHNNYNSKNHHNNHHSNHHSNNDLDGNGRLLPSISEKVLQHIEACNTHLGDSVVADALVWKDCVEYRFKRNVGLLRPPTLFVPWPILVQEIQQHGEILSSAVLCKDSTTGIAPMNSSVDETRISNAIRVLRDMTWNVSLLRDTGIGKLVKRIIKKYHPSSDHSSKQQQQHQQQNVVGYVDILQQLMSGWKDLAVRTTGDGTYRWTTIDDAELRLPSTVKSPPPPPLLSSSSSSLQTTASEDLQLLEKCLSWRQLYHALDHRKSTIQATQGKRMRDIRDNVEKHRPKLVKVRPTAKAKQLQIKVDPFVGGDTKFSSSSNNVKIAALRNEATIQAGRLQVNGPKKPSFGDAVAFAAVTKKGMAHKRKVMGGTIQQLKNGKRMKIPSALSSTTGTTRASPSRQFASVYKSAPDKNNSNRKKT